MANNTLLPAMLKAVMKGQPKAREDSHYPGWHWRRSPGCLTIPMGLSISTGTITCSTSGTPWAVSISINAGATGALRICCTGRMNLSRCCQTKSTTGAAAIQAAR